LADSSKYEAFLNEINSLEKQVYLLVQKGNELFAKNSSLEKKTKQLEKENEVLRSKIEEIEKKLSGNVTNFETELFNSFSVPYEDKDNLKKKINELIVKIDRQLSS
jgi:predicted  nucleic acid-binding Zn-ribbon protein